MKKRFFVGIALLAMLLTAFVVAPSVTNATTPAGARVSHMDCSEILIVEPQAPEGLEGTHVTVTVNGSDYVSDGGYYNGPTAKWSVPSSAWYSGPGTYTITVVVMPAGANAEVGNLPFSAELDCGAPPTPPQQNSLTLDKVETCDGWVVSYDASEGATVTANPGFVGDWSGGDSVVVTVTAKWESGEPLEISNDITVTKPENCTPPQENHLTLTSNANCDGWSVTVDVNGEPTISAEPGLSGIWGDDETSVLVSVTAVWENGSLGDEVLINKPENCDTPPVENYLILDLDPTCEEWEVLVDASDGASIVADPGLSGVWEEGQTEVVVTVTAKWESGEPLEISEQGTITRLTGCDAPPPPPPPAPLCVDMDGNPMDRVPDGWYVDNGVCKPRFQWGEDTCDVRDLSFADQSLVLPYGIVGFEPAANARYDPYDPTKRSLVFGHPTFSEGLRVYAGPFTYTVHAAGGNWTCTSAAPPAPALPAECINEVVGSDAFYASQGCTDDYEVKVDGESVYFNDNFTNMRIRVPLPEDWSVIDTFVYGAPWGHYEH